MPMNKKILAAAAGALVLSAAGIVAVMAAVDFKPHEQPIGYVGQPVASNANVASGTAKMYAIDYTAGEWTGNLHSFKISAAGVVSATDDWNGGASAQVANQVLNNLRRIVTIKGTTGAEFTWSHLSDAQKTALDAASAGATTSPVLDYLRGVKSNEGTAAGKFRVRAEALGDIIHSTPVVTSQGGKTTVFVGANDGMLHAFNAEDGSEQFAYVPNVLLPRLAALASPAYKHQYYVDGRLDVRDFGGTKVLVGLLGGGGKAIYGINVTAAATSQADAASKVLWEITNATSGFESLGDTYGAPTLFELASDKPALVVGNGYNNTGSKRAMLYLINPVTGALIRSFDTGGSGSAGNAGGLSSPSLWDSDGNGYKDTAYAGDIDGNVWRFLLTSPYTVTKVFANTGGDAAHAITMAPGLSPHPFGGVMIHFVTGRLLSADDVSSDAFHYAYGVWDKAPDENKSFFEQTLTEAIHKNGLVETRVRTSSATAPNWTKGHDKGWRTKLPQSGERVVGDGAFVTNGVFQFLSTNPTKLPNGKPPGENWWMQLNALTGGGTGTTQFDLNGDKKFTSADSVDGKEAVGRMMGGGVRSQLIGLSAGGVDVYHSNYDRNGAPVTATTPPKVTTENISGSRGVSGGHFDTDIFCYTYCGGYSGNNGIGVETPDEGTYYPGRQFSTVGTTANMKFVHVHEYDDIYDRIGLSMLHPSQDLQRLKLVKPSIVTYSPDLPAHVKNGTYPNGSTQTITATTGLKNKATGKYPPTWEPVYTHGAVTKVSGPTVTIVSGVTESVTVETYTTTRTHDLAINTTTGKNPWYDIQTTKNSWLTTRSTKTVSFGFKVLVANQAYSPALTLTIKDGGALPLAAGYDGKAWQFQNKAGLKVASLPTYDIDKLSELKLSMPLDAFNNRDWGTGVVRTGLHPMYYTCGGVNAGNTGPKAGPNGEWRNGAISVQIVEPDVTDAEIQLNVADRPELGYRLTNSAYPGKIIAEYQIYWHHPNNLCMGDTGWTKEPPQDASKPTAKPGKPAPGADDPVGEFKPGTGEDTTVQVPVNPPPHVVSNADGSTTTTTITYVANAAGGYTKTTSVQVTPAGGTAGSGGEGDVQTGGAVNAEGIINTGGIDRNAAALGRINWRELQK